MSGDNILERSQSIAPHLHGVFSLKTSKAMAEQYSLRQEKINSVICYFSFFGSKRSPVHTRRFASGFHLDPKLLSILEASQLQIHLVQLQPDGIIIGIASQPPLVPCRLFLVLEADYDVDIGRGP